MRRELDGVVSEATFVLSEGKRTPLSPGDFTSVLREATVSRGGLQVSGEAKADGPGGGGEGERGCAQAGAVQRGVVARGEHERGVRGPPVENRAALGVMNDGTALVGGLAMALVSNMYEEEAPRPAGGPGRQHGGGQRARGAAGLALNVTSEGSRRSAGVRRPNVAAESVGWGSSRWA